MKIAKKMICLALVATLTMSAFPGKANADIAVKNTAEQTEEVKNLFKEELKKNNPGHEKEIDGAVNAQTGKIKNILEITNRNFDATKNWAKEQWDFANKQFEHEREREKWRWEQEREREKWQREQANKERDRRWEKEDDSFEERLKIILSSPWLLFPMLIVLGGAIVVGGVSLICHIPIVDKGCELVSNKVSSAL